MDVISVFRGYVRLKLSTNIHCDACDIVDGGIGHAHSSIELKKKVVVDTLLRWSIFFINIAFGAIFGIVTIPIISDGFTTIFGITTAVDIARVSQITWT